MKTAKIFIVLTFLLAFAVCVSAQEQTPKIVWKNLQEKYERFEDINPILVNESDNTIFMFADTKSGIVHDYLELYRYFEDYDKWSEILHHGHPVNKKYQEKIMSNFKIQPQRERPIIFDKEDWLFLTESDGLMPYGFRDNPDYKGRGKYKFKLQFYVGEKKLRKIFIIESPVFEIIKDQKSFFDK